MTPGRLAGLSLTAMLALACSDSTGPGPGPETAPAPALVAIGETHLCRVTDTSTRCWGRGTLGQLGIGTQPAETIPVPLSDPPHFRSIAAGYTHTCAIDDAGAAWCWGSNFGGELGTGSLPDQHCGGIACQTVPVKVATSDRFSALAAGYGFTCGLTVAGSVLCWGLNDEGQLGTTASGDTCESLRCSRTPLLAANGAHFNRISAGKAHVCALAPDGKAWCWGYDASGDVERHRGESPTLAPALVSDSLVFTEIASGGFHACALDAGGAAWCWGLDALGAGESVLLTVVPVPVIGGHSFRQIQSGRVTSCGLDQQGHAFCWGANGNGEVGVERDGTVTQYYEPTPVSGNFSFTALAGEMANYCGLTAEGSLVCWGRGEEGQLVNGGQNSGTPVVVMP